MIFQSTTDNMVNMERTPSRTREVKCQCGITFTANHSQAKYCKSCKILALRKTWNKYSSKNREKRKIYSREWYEQNKEKRLLQIKEYNQTKAGKLSTKHSTQNQITKYPEKIKARWIVKNAIKCGKLVRKTCKICREVAHAHHEDYTKPLEVIWLCDKHHKLRHKQIITPLTRWVKQSNIKI